MAGLIEALKANGVVDLQDRESAYTKTGETGFRFFGPLKQLHDASAANDEQAAQAAAQKLLDRIATSLPSAGERSEAAKEEWKAKFNVSVDKTTELDQQLRSAIAAAGLEGTIKLPAQVRMSPEQETIEQAREKLRFISGPNGYNTFLGQTDKVNHSPFPKNAEGTPIFLDDLAITTEQAQWVLAKGEKENRILLQNSHGDFGNTFSERGFGWNVFTDPAAADARKAFDAHLASPEMVAKATLAKIYPPSGARSLAGEMYKQNFTPEQVAFIGAHADNIQGMKGSKVYGFQEVIFNPEMAEQRAATVAMFEGRETPVVLEAKAILGQLGYQDSEKFPLTAEHAQFIITNRDKITPDSEFEEAALSVSSSAAKARAEISNGAAAGAAPSTQGGAQAGAGAQQVAGQAAGRANGAGR